MHAYTLPKQANYTLCNATVPAAVIHGLPCANPPVDKDGLLTVDIAIEAGRIAAIRLGGGGVTEALNGECVVDMGRGMVLPTFVDLHCHIDKGHTCDRSRNPTGSLGGADKSTAADLAFWDAEDVERRMDFALRCAYAHGTSALRTHLINLVPKQMELTWAAFNKMRRRWRGRIELQGVSLVVLSYFRDADAGARLADTVKAAGGILGCAVCCSESGGMDDDDWTTCNADRPALLDRIFLLAKERGLLLDFHVDENGNPEAQGLRCIAQAAIRHEYQGKVVCGHCCSLSCQSDEELDKTLQLCHAAGLAVVSLPLVNEWTQDRDPRALRTPRWRGITCLRELKAYGVPVAVASDNTRDQFYAYGDLDMLEVFNVAVRLGHLDRPSMGSWPKIITSTPATAMGLRGRHGVIRVGQSANLVLLRGRNYGEVCSRPQFDRVVVRNGRPVTDPLPDYSELDYDVRGRKYCAPPPVPPAMPAPVDAVAQQQQQQQSKDERTGGGIAKVASLKQSAPSFAAAFGGGEANGWRAQQRNTANSRAS
jgi:cytosine/adenosine deaminase-related metal-dependent hydrolase